eukprot:3908887-Pyramimonas_sp.AAC.1
MFVTGLEIFKHLVEVCDNKALPVSLSPLQDSLGVVRIGSPHSHRQAARTRLIPKRFPADTVRIGTK